MIRDTEGARIARARRELGILLDVDVGQADLARLLDTDLSSVWNWENDNKRPNDQSRAKLSKVLGVTEAYLRYGTEPKSLEGWSPPEQRPPVTMPLAIPHPRSAAKKVANDHGRKRRGR